MTSDLSRRPVVLEGEFVARDVECTPAVNPWVPLVLLYGPALAVIAAVVFLLATR